MVLNAKFMELVRNVLPQITKFMKLEYLHDYFTPLPKLKPIMGKIKKTVLLLDEIKAFDNIGIKVTEPILTFRVLKRMHDQLHSYNHKSVKNGSICEIEPGKNFITIKYFCQLPNNNTYALGYLFTNKDDVFYDTTTNDDGLPDLHLADSITHRFFYLVGRQQPTNVIVVNTKSLLKKCIYIPMKNADFDVIVPLANVLEHY